MDELDLSLIAELLLQPLSLQQETQKNSSLFLSQLPQPRPLLASSSSKLQGPRPHSRFSVKPSFSEKKKQLFLMAPRILDINYWLNNRSLHQHL